MSDDVVAELELIERDVAELGTKLDQHKKRALEIMRGRIATVRGKRFEITHARIYEGGLNTRIFFSGPVLTKDGTLHARATESAPLGLIDKLEDPRP